VGGRARACSVNQMYSQLQRDLSRGIAEQGKVFQLGRDIRKLLDDSLEEGKSSRSRVHFPRLLEKLTRTAALEQEQLGRLVSKAEQLRQA
jgi:hypothetical protein